MTSTGLPALATCDLVISRGADNIYTFVWKTSNGAQPPVVTPVDITGYTAHAQLRRRVGQPVWLDLTSSPLAGIVLGGATGTVTITVSRANTTSDDWSSYVEGVWDLEMTSPGGIVTRLVQGKVTVSQDVTR